MPVYVAVESLFYILQYFYLQYSSLHLTNPTNITICFLSVLSPKVIGIAIARYDFCARDMRELSLLKGDVVKIYTKMSANGWWRGEVNGRVRLFFFLSLCLISAFTDSDFFTRWNMFSYLLHRSQAELLPGSFPSI